MKYRYAPLDHIVSQVREMLAKHGFSYDFDTEHAESGGVTVICTASHRDGHSKQTRVYMPAMRIPESSDWQNLSGSITLAQRRSFCGAFGILTGEEDLDGHGPTPPEKTITEKQAADLQVLLDEVRHGPKDRFFAWANIERIEDLPASKFDAAVGMAEEKRRRDDDNDSNG